MNRTPASRLTRLSEGTPSTVLFTPLWHDARIWGGFAQSLASDVGLTVVEWPGHGASSHSLVPGDLDLFDEAEKVLDHLGEPDVLIASGKEVQDVRPAIHLALGARANVLVLVHPSPDGLVSESGVDFDAVLQRRFAELQPEVIEAFESKDLATFAQLEASRYQSLLDPQEVELIRTVLEDNFVFPDERPPKRHPEFSWIHAIREVWVPILVVGPEGADLPGHAINKALADRAPNGRFAGVGEEGGYPWLEKPEKMVHVVRSFLRETLWDSKEVHRHE